MRKYAVLVDAGFLKRKLGSREDPVTADRVQEFISSIQDHSYLSNLLLYRVYYYDAPPLENSISRPLNGGKIHLGESDLAKSNKRILEKLKEAPFFALRMGDLKFRGWKIAPYCLPKGKDSVQIGPDNLTPNIQQKGVDMRLGLDIASLTLKKQVDVIVLVAGDSDFVPAMKFARKEGVQVILVTLGHRVMESVIEHADLVVASEWSGSST